MKVPYLSRQQAGFDLRETAEKCIIGLQHEIHVLDVLVILVLLERNVERHLRNLVVIVWRGPIVMSDGLHAFENLVVRGGREALRMI